MNNINGQWKREKDGLKIMDELDMISNQTWKELDPGDVERLKWAGIYAQRPKDGYFLIRVRLSSGELTSAQARAIAEISRLYGKDSIQITIRQCIQVHNIEQKYISKVVSLLKDVELTSVEGCGDVPRNILGNPLMGIDINECIDTTDLVRRVADAFVGNPAYSNLPRKFKISISGSPGDSGFAKINDIALVPAIKKQRKKSIYGFHVYVGGGLSTHPVLATPLSFFLKEEEAFPVIEAVLQIFRDYGYREKRGHARLKFLIEDWGTEKLEKIIESITGPLDRGGRVLRRHWNRGAFYGIHQQKQKGLYYAGCSIPNGMLTPAQLDEFAALAETYGDGSLRTTNSQNLLLINLTEKKLSAFRKEKIFRTFALHPGKLSGYCTSCTGNTYCNFAPVETKKHLNDIVEALEKKYPSLPHPIRINLTGCVHSCAHPQIADLGLTGGLQKINGVPTPVYTLQIGGNLGPNAHFSYPLEGKIPDSDIVDVLDEMISYYLTHKKYKETFHQCVQRVGTSPFQWIVSSYTKS